MQPADIQWCAAQEQYAQVGYEHAQQLPEAQGQSEEEAKFGPMGDLQQQQGQMQPPGETLVEKRKRLGR